MPNSRSAVWRNLARSLRAAGNVAEARSGSTYGGDARAPSMDSRPLSAHAAGAAAQ